MKEMSLVSHTCARCGAEFKGAIREYVCSGCAKSTQGKIRDYHRPLTARERQVIERLATGVANKEIAALLHLSEGTIKEYLHVIFRKVGVSNRLELALWWLQHAPASAPAEPSQPGAELAA